MNYQLVWKNSVGRKAFLQNNITFFKSGLIKPYLLLVIQK